MDLSKNRENLSKQVELELRRQLYKQSYFDFFQDAVKVLEPNTDWDFNFHHQYLCELLQAEAERITRKESKTVDYNINIPPRTSKSLIVSVVFPVWVWACVNPHMVFLTISHSEGLAVDLASKCKDLIESEWFKELFPHIQIRQDTQAKSNFQNTFGGKRISTSMGANITGHGANVIVIDDSIDANNVSDINLENTIRKYKESIFNRLNNPKTDLRIIIGQRVHEGDLSGHILASNKGKYKHICLPMELTEDVHPVELRDKYAHGVLWHSRFPLGVVNDLVDSSYVYATQYLQRPAPLTGGIIKKNWFEIVESTPVGIQYDLFIDAAYTNNKSNDATAILLAGAKDNILYVKKVYELWLEFPDLLKKIQEIVNVESSRNCKVFIEPKASGKSIAQQLRKETMLNVIELEAPKDSKVARVNAITGKLESKRVKLVKGDWTDNFLFQCSTFPNAKRDDMVDTLQMAVNKLLIQSNKIRWYM